MVKFLGSKSALLSRSNELSQPDLKQQLRLSPREDRLASAPSSLRVTPVQPKAKIDRLAKEIESILSENLTDIYLAMPPDKAAENLTKAKKRLQKFVKLVRAVVNAENFQLIH